MPAVVPEGKCTQKSFKCCSELLIPSSLTDLWKRDKVRILIELDLYDQSPLHLASPYKPTKYSTVLIFLENRYLWSACYEPAIVLVTDPHARSALTTSSQQVFKS